MNMRIANLCKFIPIVVIVGATLACDRYEIVIDDLSQRDANEILVVLRDHQIEAKKVGQTTKKSVIYRIEVKEQCAKDALRLLVHNQIPKIQRAGLKEVYPPGGSGIIPSKSDELARMTMAMQGEIEALLKVIPGIADARVVISYDSPLDYQKSATKKTASVAVIYHPQGEIGEAPMNDAEVKNLIAASIGGLLPENVTVVQKIIEPIKNSSEEILSGTQNEKPAATKNNFMLSPWLLLALTLLALAIAAYAIIRLALERRVLNKEGMQNG